MSFRRAAAAMAGAGGGGARAAAATALADCVLLLPPELASWQYEHFPQSAAGTSFAASDGSCSLAHLICIAQMNVEPVEVSTILCLEVWCHMRAVLGSWRMQKERKGWPLMLAIIAFVRPTFGVCGSSKVCPRSRPSSAGGVLSSGWRSKSAYRPPYL